MKGLKVLGQTHACGICVDWACESWANEPTSMPYSFMTIWENKAIGTASCLLILVLENREENVMTVIYFDH